MKRIHKESTADKITVKIILLIFDFVGFMSVLFAKIMFYIVKTNIFLQGQRAVLMQQKTPASLYTGDAISITFMFRV
ncbi:MAG: hypothetical protein IJU27_08380 [Bacteroidales bacterium]|nr:hypothetical protein [Bacteroidales bacterium]